MTRHVAQPVLSWYLSRALLPLLVRLSISFSLVRACERVTHVLHGAGKGDRVAQRCHTTG